VVVEVVVDDVVVVCGVVVVVDTVVVVLGAIVDAVVGIVAFDVVDVRTARSLHP
jgi:hypothetical protein